jgi:hypothetical protein
MFSCAVRWWHCVGVLLPLTHPNMYGMISPAGRGYLPRIFWFLVVPTVLAAFVGIWYNARSVVPQAELLPILGSFHKRLPASYRAADNASFQTYDRIRPGSASSAPNVSAIVLNWSRFHNVLSIVSVLCSHSLGDLIADVVVWNNNPRPLSHSVCHHPLTLCYP